MTKVEQWRNDRGYSYRELGRLLGCSHQYARNLCQHGTAASIKLIKLIAISGGELELQDFLCDEDRTALEEQGFIQKDEYIV